MRAELKFGPAGGGRQAGVSAGAPMSDGEFQVMQQAELPPPGRRITTHFGIELVPEIAGLQYYMLRMYPYNDALCHPLKWAS